MPVTAFGENTVFYCQCEQPVYFRNSHCLSCQKALGYDPYRFTVSSLSPSDIAGHWQTDQHQQTVKRCANFELAGCNWLEPADSPHSLCLSCRLTRIAPDLSAEGNNERWRKIELEKRRLIAQLLSMDLPLPDREAFPDSGLAFDLLGEDEDGNLPLTGHANGLITLNIKEADDDYRATVRAAMAEPYRTLLGHFRHEIGHFYWDVLIRDSHWLQACRHVFGDEQYSYKEALDQYYKNGAPSDWPQRFISAYATMHPWEDWAETWAHYLHMMATLNAAAAFGMHAPEGKFELIPYTREALYAPHDVEADDFLNLVNTWIELTAMLNVLARTMGQPDIYPFALPAPVIAKLQFIHIVVRDTASPPALDTLE